MTVTVSIRTRAVGATVQIGDETIELGAHTPIRDFHIHGSETMTIKEAQPSADDHPNLPLDPNDVPGRSENDRLLKGGSNGEDDPSTQRRQD